MADTTTLLAQLRDIKQPLPPESVSLWLIAANVFVACIILAALWYRRQHDTRGWRRQFIKDLRQAQSQPPDKAYVNAATQLRQLMLFYGYKVENLSGAPWLQTLDRQFDTHWFTQGTGQVFGDALYQPKNIEQHDIDSVFNKLEALIKSLPPRQRHKVPST